MKAAIIFVSVLLASTAYAKGDYGRHHSSMPSFGTGSKSSHEHVSGYTNRDGNYVAPHEKSTPDYTKNNNWDTKGGQGCFARRSVRFPHNSSFI
jgi:hypothetical protein